MVIACGGEAAGVSKTTSRARLRKQQPRAEKKQRERDPLRKNRGRRQKTGGKGK
jgi:hypothetical protein